MLFSIVDTTAQNLRHNYGCRCTVPLLRSINGPFQYGGHLWYIGPQKQLLMRHLCIYLHVWHHQDTGISCWVPTSMCCFSWEGVKSRWELRESTKNKSAGPSEFSPHLAIVNARDIISFARPIDTLIITVPFLLYALCEKIADMSVCCTRRPKGFRHLGFVSG